MKRMTPDQAKEVLNDCLPFGMAADAACNALLQTIHEAEGGRKSEPLVCVIIRRDEVLSVGTNYAHFPDGREYIKATLEHLAQMTDAPAPPDSELGKADAQKN